MLLVTMNKLLADGQLDRDVRRDADYPRCAVGKAVAVRLQDSFYN
jgi:hypothetical protein